jgi:hypothetical protein
MSEAIFWLLLLLGMSTFGIYLASFFAGSDSLYPPDDREDED